MGATFALKKQTGRLKAEMEAAAGRGVFPGGILLTAVGEETSIIPAGRLCYDPNAPEATPRTVYDLASMTKILSTTLLTMIYVDRRKVRLDDDLPHFWPDLVTDDKKAITIRHLLAHTTGWPAWRKVYWDLEGLPDEKRRPAAIRAILDTDLEADPGRRTIYSDLNFILLGLILEKIGGARQDELFERLVTTPLSVADVFYRPLDHSRVRAEDLAPTEHGLRRSGPPGSGLGEPRDGVVIGAPHDDNAAALTGVAGNAGLFGTAAGIWRIFNALRRAFLDLPGQHPVSGKTVREFWSSEPPADSNRALGFDRPFGESQAGRLFSKESVGHTGFTGTSLWHDPTRDLTVVLLTNRVHPSADNTAILEFRPRLHDLIVELLG